MEALRRAAGPSEVDSAQSQLLHTFEVDCVGSNVCSKNIIGQREHHIEIPVLVSVMQPVISGEKPVDRPGAEDPLLRLVHLEMDFVPHPVVKTHRGDEYSGARPGHQRNDRSEWDSLDRRLAQSQTYLSVFSSSHRLVSEYLGVMAMMDQRVSLKYALVRCSMPTEEVPSVHQPAVHLLLDEGDQTARDNEPADKLQKEHHIADDTSRRRRERA